MRGDVARSVAVVVRAERRHAAAPRAEHAVLEPLARVAAQVLPHSLFAQAVLPRSEWKGCNRPGAFAHKPTFQREPDAFAGLDVKADARPLQRQ